jgi:hypothetical protein
MDYKPYTPFSDENIDGHILFGMTGKLCRTTIANGKLLMKDRELVGIDEEAKTRTFWSPPRSSGARSTTANIDEFDKGRR